MIEDSTIHPVIMVCADNSPDPFDGSMYMNSPIWGNYEDYMIGDLVNWIESSFRVIPERNGRALLGVSMGGYGVFRYGILYKEKFKVMAATAIQGLNISDDMLDYARSAILQQNQPGPPYFYDYNNSGSTTMFFFLLCGAWTPNLNSTQTYINPQNVDWPLDENGEYIDTIVSPMISHTIDNYIDELLPEDSSGILFGCGSGDETIYPGHLEFKDLLDSLGLPNEFYDHTGGHIIPFGFKKRALVFIDSLLSPPVENFGINSHLNYSKSFKLRIYPNPSVDFIQFELIESQRILELEIFSINGQAYKYNSVSNRINISRLSPGIYILEARTESGVVREKFVKE